MNSKKTLVMLFVYSFIITFAWVNILKDIIIGIIWLLICIIYLAVILFSKPWNLLNSREREIYRSIWSLLIAGSSTFTFWTIAYMMGIASGKSYTELFLETVGIMAIYFYFYNKKSKVYLEISLRDGGIWKYRS